MTLAVFDLPNGLKIAVNPQYVLALRAGSKDGRPILGTTWIDMTTGMSMLVSATLTDTARRLEGGSALVGGEES